MTAVLPESGQSAAKPLTERRALALRWNAIHDAAEAVAALAGIDPDKPSGAVTGFPAAIRNAETNKVELAEQGIGDIGAMLEPGLAALLAVNARGQDATAAARALWNEFQKARDALLALAPHGGTMGPRRSA